MLTNPSNINNSMQSIMHASRPIVDLDEATKYWQLGKDLLLGDAVTSYFSSNSTAIWKWDLSRQSLSGDFLGVPIMREVIMRAITPSMSGGIPGHRNDSWSGFGC